MTIIVRKNKDVNEHERLSNYKFIDKLNYCLTLKKYGELCRDNQCSLLCRLQCTYSFSQSTTEFFSKKKYGELCRDKQCSLLYRLQCTYSFSQSTTQVFSMKKYGELCKDKQCSRLCRYNVPTLLRSLQQRSLA